MSPNEQSMSPNEQSMSPNEQSVSPNEQSMSPNEQSMSPNEQSISGLLDRFRTKIVGHPILKEAYEKTLRVIEEPAGASVAVVVGPTGVGKSTLRERLKRQLLDD